MSKVVAMLVSMPDEYDLARVIGHRACFSASFIAEFAVGDDGSLRGVGTTKDRFAGPRKEESAFKLVDLLAERLLDLGKKTNEEMKGPTAEDLARAEADRLREVRFRTMETHRFPDGDREET